ncbi:MAG: hypothetical protein RL745_751 [Actinomycetota bacterium]
MTPPRAAAKRVSRSSAPSPAGGSVGGQADAGARRRAQTIYRRLQREYPDAHCELDFSSPLQLLVATMLSAQCTDKRVNMVTPALFRRYPTAGAFAGAKQSELEDSIRSTGFFRTKATNIIAMAQTLCEEFGGEVPADLDALVQLPGVGRKTANVVLGNAFAIPGLTVDTHFGRLVRRFGWTNQVDPVKVEREVAQLIPQSEWTNLSHQLIWHGRRCCHARKPACGACVLADVCPAFGTGPTDPAQARALLKSTSSAS